MMSSSDPETSQPRFDPRGHFAEAVSYAIDLHAEQTRKGTDIPYIAHLLAVAALVVEHGGDEDESTAALLHDAAEDAPPHHGGGEAVLDRLEQRFGSRVAGIVRACSDTLVQPKPDWRPRKEAHLAHLAAADGSVRLVTAADKLHNLRSIVADVRLHGESLWKRFNAGPRDVLWYYESIRDELRARPEPRLAPLLTELSELVEDLATMVSERPLAGS
jgi:(p)ppGpp synthase/HD superfamily hydrolase